MSWNDLIFVFVATFGITSILAVLGVELFKAWRYRSARKKLLKRGLINKQTRSGYNEPVKWQAAHEARLKAKSDATWSFEWQRGYNAGYSEAKGDVRKLHDQNQALQEQVEKAEAELAIARRKPTTREILEGAGLL